MSNKAVIFVHQNPYPPKFGFLSRVLSIIKGFRDLGYQVYLLSNELNWAAPWTPESIAFLEEQWVESVRIYKISLWDYRIRRLLKMVYAKTIHEYPPMFSMFYTPPGMRCWFNREIETIKPDLIMINYARFDRLLDHKRFKSTRRIIDTIDLQSLNLNMQENLRKLLPSEPVHPAKAGEAILQEDFYEHAPHKMDRREFRIYDRYTHTVAIAKTEVDIIKKNTRKTQVVFIPMMLDAPEVLNLYDGSALFPTGPNPFNIQGYVYFVRRVLPLVLKGNPDFILQITGSLTPAQIVPVPGVEIVGFVPDLIPYYEKSGFVISPVFGGTGQQIKIIEAMAHGLPVIALQEAAERSPLIHGVNGLVAHDAKEFAEHVCLLWSNRAMCRLLGQAARQTIQQKYSQLQMKDELSKMLA